MATNFETEPTTQVGAKSNANPSRHVGNAHHLQKLDTSAKLIHM